MNQGDPGHALGGSSDCESLFGPPSLAVKAPQTRPTHPLPWHMQPEDRKVDVECHQQDVRRGEIGVLNGRLTA